MMTRTTALLAIALLLTALSAGADENVCPCIPKTEVWTVTTCETWNCASSALILANGDPLVMALPTNSAQYKWVVLRRVVAGSAVVFPEPAYRIEPYTKMIEGSSRFESIDKTYAPMVVTATDGSVLVLSLREPEPRTRTVAH